VGSFTSNITGLTPNTTYYVRAYATNEDGTGYGNQIVFTTLTVPTVITSAVSNISYTSATSGGNVTDDGGASVTARGVCWSTSQNPTISNSHTTNGSGTGSFISNITGLNPNTTYYVRAFATNIFGIGYGNQISFTTLQITLPTVTTSSITNITSTTATSGGNVTNDGGGTVTARGVCWGTSQNPTIAGNHTTNGSGLGSFTSQITGLNPSTTYYVRAYATNSSGTAYGNQINFETIDFPTVTTNSVTNITTTTATSGGNVIDDGGSIVTARGVCWSTSPNPTISNSHTIDGSGLGNFVSNISGLNSNTTYYVRAYATNNAGNAYGNQVNFETIDFPSVTTNSVTNITTTTATSGGIVIDDGGSTVTFRGVCWGTSPNPTISNSHTIDGSGLGNFVSNITGLIPDQNYYVRAYATNNAGTAYGNQISFTTDDLAIGDYYAGGIVFYLNGSGGLVCAPEDQSSSPWGCYGISIGGTSTAIGTGASNTQLIVSGCSELGIAARICNDLELNNYVDWFLPSKNELTLMYTNLKYYGFGNFSEAHYWSSSEIDSEWAYSVSFIEGNSSNGYKPSPMHVRAVRDFNY
jgi:hypothetical protein